MVIVPENQTKSNSFVQDLNVFRRFCLLWEFPLRYYCYLSIVRAFLFVFVCVCVCHKISAPRSV